MQVGNGVGSALLEKNFLIYSFGLAVSLTGTFVQSVAVNWLLFRLSDSAFALGLLSFLTEAPAVAVALLCGSLIDRIGPIRVMISTRVLTIVQSLLLAALALSGQVGIASLLILGCIQGFINGFDSPARQVVVTRLIASDTDLRKGIVVNAMVFDGARMLGPAAGGLLIAGLSEGYCFLVNAASGAVLLAALVALRIPQHDRPQRNESLPQSIADGFRYVMSTKQIRLVLMVVAVVAFAGASATVLLPIMVTTVLQGGPAMLGALTAAVGVGALGGGLMMLMTRHMSLTPIQSVTVGVILFGAALIGFASSHIFPLSMLFTGMAGLGLMIVMSSAHTMLLIETPEDKRGRVMGVYSMSYMMTAPLGSVAAGAVGGLVGTPVTILGGGAIIVLAGLVLAAACRGSFPVDNGRA